MLSTLSKKLSKDSYDKWFRVYRPGILVLTERDPLYYPVYMDCIMEKMGSESFEDKRYFKNVFPGYRSMGGLDFIEVEYCNS